MRLKILAPYGMLVILAIILDQWIKFLVETRLDMRMVVEILPFFSLFRTHNTGVAFSLLSGFGSVPLIALTIAVIAIILWIAARSTPDQRASRLGFALIIGGALGNLIDRVALGYVVDYALIHWGNWSFAVFNLADAFITVGAGLVILDEFASWRRERRKGEKRGSP